MPLFHVCFLYLPYLHSCPTRRSSDLQTVQARGGSRGDEGGQGVGRVATFPPDATLGVACHTGTGRAVAPARGGRDRKSTRLNSSHLGISYAVFCLKKKRRLLFC